MKVIAETFEVPAIVNGCKIGATPLTAAVWEFPTQVVATVNFGRRRIGEREFAAGTNLEDAMATIKKVLTPEPYLRHS